MCLSAFLGDRGARLALDFEPDLPEEPLDLLHPLMGTWGNGVGVEILLGYVEWLAERDPEMDEVAILARVRGAALHIEHDNTAFLEFLDVVAETADQEPSVFFDYCKSLCDQRLHEWRR